MILNLIKLARPKQWIKNFFVFAPLLFSKHIFEPFYVMVSFEAFAAFCFASSSIYVLNDIMDADADRVHPRKKYRPIASGEISVNQGWLYFALLILITALLLIVQKWQVTAVIVVYIITNFLYSAFVKSIVLLDVFFISFGFMIRILGGAAAIGVSLSSWMVLCSIFLSLFLAISKRRAELSQVVNQDNLVQQRKVLKEYSIDFADQLNTIVAAGTIITYALYTVSERTVETFGTGGLIYTTPFVLYGIFRYMYLIHKKNMGESPTTIVVKDIPIILNVLMWFIACIIIIYKINIPLVTPALKGILP